MRSLIEKHLSSRYSRYTLNTLGVTYLIVLALEYYPPAMKIAQPQLTMADNILNLIFLIELGLRVYVYRRDFFKKMFSFNLPQKKPVEVSYPLPNPLPEGEGTNGILDIPSPPGRGLGRG